MSRDNRIASWSESIHEPHANCMASIECNEPTRRRVFNSSGSPVGDYCTGHGFRRVEQMNRMAMQ